MGGSAWYFIFISLALFVFFPSHFVFDSYCSLGSLDSLETAEQRVQARRTVIYHKMQQQQQFQQHQLPPTQAQQPQQQQQEQKDGMDVVAAPSNATDAEGDANKILFVKGIKDGTREGAGNHFSFFLSFAPFLLLFYNFFFKCLGYSA
jgi:hypothetical protein